MELRLTDGKQSGELIRVPLQDLRKVEVSQGKGGLGWSAAQGALRGAAIVAPVLMILIAGDYDSEDLQYGSMGEGAFYGFLAGALLGAAIGAPIGAMVNFERWRTVPGAEFRHGVTPRPPTIPYRFLGLRGGWNGQSRKEATDPPDVPNGGLSGGSGALGYTVGFRVTEAWRLEFDFWRPNRIVVSPGTFLEEGKRTFRDYSLSLSIVSEFKTSARVRPYWVIGLGAVRVVEEGLSERKSYGGLVSGIGAEVNLGRHLAIAPDVRVNFPIDPYENRFSFRPSIGMVVRF